MQEKKHKQPPQDSEIKESGESESREILNEKRREFLSVAKKFSTVVAILGLTSAGLAGGSNGEKNPIQQLLHSAINSGNMELAIKKYGKQAQLKERHLKALRSLTKHELLLLRTIKQKLAPLSDRINNLKLEM
jgi:hypothetical protein